VVEERHVLLESLHAAGFEHEDIDVVVLSHLHFDHAGGLLAAWTQGRAPELLFPNATFLVSEACWDRATHPHPRDRASFIPGLPALLEGSGRLEIVDGTHSQALGKAVRFHFSDGHTPGLMLAEIVGPEHVHGEDHGGVVFCADLIPGRPWVHVPITMGYDRNPELLIDEKREFLDDKLARNVHLFFTHDPGCALAQVTRDARGRFGTAHEVAELHARALPA
jgi:glyoxylase-like metal-dependent hydrolase (beta-lactamase superfamily II)